MAQCKKCGSSMLMRLPSSEEGKTHWQCIECGNKWYEEKKPLKLFRTR